MPQRADGRFRGLTFTAYAQSANGYHRSLKIPKGGASAAPTRSLVTRENAGRPPTKDNPPAFQPEISGEVN